MKYREERTRIVIEPTNDIEIAYIEEVFGMKQDGDKIELVRKNAMGLSCIAYLETKRMPQQKDMAVAWQPTSVAEFIANSSQPSKFTQRIADFVVEMHNDFPKINTADVEEFYERGLQEAFATGNYVRVANFAMLLSKPDQNRD